MCLRRRRALFVDLRHRDLAVNLKGRFRDAIVAGAADTGRIPFLLNDLVIEEQLCHLKCEYCLTEDYNVLMAVPDAQLRLTTDKRRDWHDVLGQFHVHVDAPVLRVSGGEFFWLRGSTEFIQECCRMYETVQIITNGVLLHERRLEALAPFSNCQLNISLDGHTLEMNRYRFPPRQSRLLDLILKNLAKAVELGIKVEIQSVLTDANVDGQLEFATYLRDNFGDRVLLYFFPIRGETAAKFAAAPGPHLDPLVERYDELASVLPPRAFVSHIARQVRDGKRTLPCFVTAMMCQLFGTGNVSACPHAWVAPMGNVVDQPQFLGESIATHRHYDLFLHDKPRFDFCNGCATPSDVLNLYLLGEVSDEEIGHCFLYSGPRTLERLRDMRERYSFVRDKGPLAVTAGGVSGG